MYHVSFWQPLGPAGPSYPELSREAIQNALDDAGITFDSVEAAVSFILNARLTCVAYRM